MRANPMLRDILDDEALTRGLGDAEARVLIEWLVDRAERLAEKGPSETATLEVSRWRKRGRAIARFVRLWSLDHACGPALQLAATERFNWPMPDTQLEACELMQDIVFWETHQEGESETQAA